MDIVAEAAAVIDSNLVIELSTCPYTVRSVATTYDSVLKRRLLGIVNDSQNLLQLLHIVVASCTANLDSCSGSVVEGHMHHEDCLVGLVDIHPSSLVISEGHHLQLHIAITAAGTTDNYCMQEGYRQVFAECLAYLEDIGWQMPPLAAELDFDQQAGYATGAAVHDGY